MPRSAPDACLHNECPVDFGLYASEDGLLPPARHELQIFLYQWEHPPDIVHPLDVFEVHPHQTLIGHQIIAFELLGGGADVNEGSQWVECDHFFHYFGVVERQRSNLPGDIVHVGQEESMHVGRQRRVGREVKFSVDICNKG